MCPTGRTTSDQGPGAQSLRQSEPLTILSTDTGALGLPLPHAKRSLSGPRGCCLVTSSRLLRPRHRQDSWGWPISELSLFLTGYNGEHTLLLDPQPPQVAQPQRSSPECPLTERRGPGG